MRVGEKSQLSVKYDNSLDLRYLEYCEDMSKNNQGGLDHCKVNHKVVRAYENKDNSERCIVQLYEFYMHVRPSHDKCPNDFYLRPLAVPKGNVWFSCQPMGRHKLSTVVADIAKHAGMEGKVTNHSLRATAASHLYQSNIDEQLVMECTGHCSNCVHGYKRTSSAQLKGVSDVLYGKPEALGVVALPQVVNVENCIDKSVGQVNVVDSVKNEKFTSANSNVGVSNCTDKQVSINVTVNINK